MSARRQSWRTVAQRWVRLPGDHRAQLSRFVQRSTGQTCTRFIVLGPQPGPRELRRLLAAGDVRPMGCVADHGELPLELERALHASANEPEAKP